ncbi:hypothetical protein L204_101580 [Cryptococcus depauperatus]|nr:hypothetical protein L204_04453 [Cryptococcus depauperatus CBS 7855]
MSGNGGRSSTGPGSSPSLLERQSSGGSSPPLSISYRNLWARFGFESSNYKKAKCGEPPEIAETASQQSSRHIQRRQQTSVGHTSTRAGVTKGDGEEIGEAERLQEVHPLLRTTPTTNAPSVTTSHNK